MRASSSLHQVRQVSGVEAVQNAAWEVARTKCPTTLGAFANTPSWPVKKSQCCTGNTSSAHMVTEQEEQDKSLGSPHPTNCIYSKVRSLGKHIFMIWEVVVLLFVFFQLHDKKEFQLFSILVDSGHDRGDTWINVMDKFNNFVQGSVIQRVYLLIHTIT